MNVSHDGLTLWYGTPDAPAPGDGGVVPRKGASLRVGVRPPSPANAVAVNYRVDGGVVQSVAGREVRTNYDRQAQYFEVMFPNFVTGNVVEYAPIVRCGPRQAPPPQMLGRFPSKFQLASTAPLAPARARAEPPARDAAQPAGLRYDSDRPFVARVSVCFEGVEYVTDTGSGMRVNYFVREGTFEGPQVKGTVLKSSADHMIVRPDGIGLIRIRAVFKTSDGAMLDVESGGQVEFGSDGYARAQAKALPDRSPLIVSPLITTRDPRYDWLSRIQCIGVGHVNLAVRQAAYYVHAVKPRNVQAVMPRNLA